MRGARGDSQILPDLTRAVCGMSFGRSRVVFGVRSLHTEDALRPGTEVGKDGT